MKVIYLSVVDLVSDFSELNLLIELDLMMTQVHFLEGRTSIYHQVLDLNLLHYPENIQQNNLFKNLFNEPAFFSWQTRTKIRTIEYGINYGGYDSD